MNKKKAVTTRAVFEFIRRRLKNGYEAPTIAEICGQLHLKSPASAWDILNELERERLITRIPHISRGIVLVENAAAEDSAIESAELEEESEIESSVEACVCEVPHDQRQFVDRDVSQAYALYLKDWRERMATFHKLQNQYMPRFRMSAGERLY